MPADPKTLGEVLSRLKAIVKEYPEAVNLPVVTAIDDEGNGYNPVYFDACVCHWDGAYDIDDIDDQHPANAVILN